MIIDKWGKMIILCLDKTINLALCWFRLKGKPKLSQVGGDGELRVKDCVADGVKRSPTSCADFS